MSLMGRWRPTASPIELPDCGRSTELPSSRHLGKPGIGQKATLTTGGFLVPCLNRLSWQSRRSELNNFAVILSRPDAEENAQEAARALLQQHRYTGRFHDDATVHLANQESPASTNTL